MSRAPDSGKSFRQDASVWHESDHWSVLRSPFQEQKGVALTNVVELKSIYGISALRDATSSTGGGSVTHTGDEYQLNVSATGDSVTFESAEFGRYIPGFGAEAGIAVRLGSTTLPSSGHRQQWGAYNDGSGFYFGRTSTGLVVGTRRESTDTDVGRANWNGDPLDGEGPSGLTLDVTRGYIYQVDYSWYGYGTIEYKVVMPTTDNRQRPIILHRESFSGRTSVENPNLPLRAELTKGSTASRDLFVAGRKYAIVGKFTPNRRRTCDRRINRTGVSTGSFVPLVSFKRKDSVTDGAQFEAASVKVATFDMIADTDMVWQIRTGASLSSTGTFGTPSEYTAAETAVESETASTGMTGGEVIDSGLISGGAKNNSKAFAEADPLEFDFKRQDPVTLCVRTTTGTGAVNSVVFSVREEW